MVDFDNLNTLVKARLTVSFPLKASELKFRVDTRMKLFTLLAQSDDDDGDDDDDDDDDNDDDKIKNDALLNIFFFSGFRSI